MRRTIIACMGLVLVPALLAGVFASGQARPQLSSEDGFELEAVIQAVSTGGGLRTVITIAPAAEYEPIRAFVLQHAMPSPLSYSGPARLRFKPGVLTLETPDGRSRQFAVQRPGVFVATPPKETLRISVIGLSSHQADPRAVVVDRWRLFLLGAGSVDAGVQSLPPGTDRPADCPFDAPTTCAGGGAGATSCSYSCAGTTCSTSCSGGYYACCWCNQSALCGCCPE